MQKILLSFSAIFLLIQAGKAQPCTSINCPTVLSIPCSTTGVGQNFSALSNYPSSITAQWYGPGNINLISIASVFSGSFMSTVNLNSTGTYTVKFNDANNACIMTKTFVVTSATFTPIAPNFNATVSNYTLFCANAPVMVTIPNAQTNPPGGAISYAIGLVGVPPVFTSNVNLSTTGCGDHYVMVKDNTNQCISSYSFNINCQLSPLPPVNIIGPSSTVCIGSSAVLTAVGANSYTWNVGATAPLITVFPTAFTGTANVYMVSGTGPTGCTGTASYTLNADTTCAMVWPGDANSDGVVNSSDVFEIGLSFNATGATRSPGGNTYSSQYASNWVGNVSTGKNRNHADCNGDGTINNNDTVAIYNNYLLTHTFKGVNNSSSNADISIETPQNFATIGTWNVADILLGSPGTPIAQLYGTAFDINFDPTQMENNGAYIVYTPSFLSASNQDVRFRKSDFNGGLAHAAVVRVDGQNVNGNGKIAEFHFKPKSSLPLNTLITLSVSNAKKISNAGISQNITTGSTSVVASNLVVGIDAASSFQKGFTLFPNPASNQLKLASGLTAEVNYTLTDIIGREITKGTFTNAKMLDLSGIENGTYLFKFESGKDTFYKKVIIKN